MPKVSEHKVAEQWLERILRAMYQHPAITRAEILEATGLNAASASHALQYLLRRGTILKIGEVGAEWRPPAGPAAAEPGCGMLRHGGSGGDAALFRPL